MPNVNKSSYSYDNRRTLIADKNARTELIGGDVYQVKTPSRRHHEVVGAMFLQLQNHIFNNRHNKCKTYYNLAVYLKEDTYIVPEKIIVCDLQKLTVEGMNGIPDLIIEVISPDASNYDNVTKFKLYNRAGVPEYWIVDPIDNIITALKLKTNGNYMVNMYGNIGKAAISVLPGYEMDLSTIFTEDPTFNTNDQSIPQT